MKIRFQNLGQIKDTTLDLKPLTVIIGPNNSNKTYVAYCVYGLLKRMRNYIAPLSIATRQNSDWISNPIPDLCAELRSDLDSAVDSFQRDLSRYFVDTSRKLFAESRFEASITDVEITEQAQSQRLGHIYGAPSQDNIIVDRTQDNRIKVWKRAAHGGAALPQGDFVTTETASVLMMQWLAQAVVPDPFLLPAERNSLVVTYKTLFGGRNKELVARLATRSQTTDSDEALAVQPYFEGVEQGFRYPQPVEDFIQFLYDAELYRESSFVSEFSPIAELIERHIQDANKTRYRSTGPGRELAVDVNTDLTIDLHNSSSSIKQLAPLIVYLRQRAKIDDLVIIDEPEMNLHPEAQAKLLEVLAILVNRGINVLITTHSPYIMQHLNNLVHSYDAKDADQQLNAKALYLGVAEAFLHNDRVNAYEMRNFELVDLHDPDYGIRWDTLSDVAYDQQEKYYQVTQPEVKQHA